MPQNLTQLLAPGAQARGLDLKALLAIAGHEGASGRIGDNGHAFGPFQLNDAGGVLTGKLAGLSPEQKNAWAWSPAGINYAEDGIAKVASGQHGAQAIQSITSKFERPADVQGEIQDALAHYGSSPGNTRVPLSAGAPRNPSSVGATGGLLGNLISNTNESLGLGSSPLLAGLFTSAAKPQTPTAAPSAVPHSQTGATGLTSLDGVQVDRAIAPELQNVLRQFPGVKPTSGYRDPTHNASVGGAENSDHLRGDAVDFGGNPGALRALYQWAQNRVPYVEPWSQTGGSHVHLSFRRP